MISLSLFEQRENEVAYLLARLRDLVRQGLVDPEIGTLSKQAQLLTEHCMRLTPPKSVTQGKKRVQLDIQKIFHPIDLNELESNSLRRIVRLGDANAWDSFARNVNKGPLAQTHAVEPTKELHAANRDNRGRARKTKMVTLYPHRKTLAALIKHKQTMVGWARAGWLRGYLALGGKRAADWVMRHTPGQGTITDARTLPDKPFISVRNLTQWGKRNDEAKRIVSDAMRARAAAMKTYFETTMKLAAQGRTLYQAQQAAIAEQFQEAA